MESSQRALSSRLRVAVTLLPALLRREYSYSMDIGLVLWLTTASFLHTIGNVFGLYGDVWWYDNITHTISSIVVAGIGYATFRAFEIHSDELDVPPAFRAVFIMVFVLAMGVLWEIIEFASGLLAEYTGGRAFLAVYGIDDIVSDMVFNTVGALIVAAGGTSRVTGLIDFLRRRLATVDEDE